MTITLGKVEGKGKRERFDSKKEATDFNLQDLTRDWSRIQKVVISQKQMTV